MCFKLQGLCVKTDIHSSVNNKKLKRKAVSLLEHVETLSLSRTPHCTPLDVLMHILLSRLWPLAGRCHCWDANPTGPFGRVLFGLIRLERAYSVVSGLKTGGIKQPALPPTAHMDFSSRMEGDKSPWPPSRSPLRA